MRHAGQMCSTCGIRRANETATSVVQTLVRSQATYPPPDTSYGELQIGSGCPEGKADTMNQATPAVRDLARLLLTLEAKQSEHGQDVQTDLRVFEKLHTYLTNLVGIAGFQALLARAVALATAEVSWLRDVRVLDDATFKGFIEAATQRPTKDVTAARAAILAQLLGLLVTFLGEVITLRLVQDVWPEVPGDAIHFSVKETRHE